MSPATLTLVLLSIWGCALSADTDLSQSAYLDPKERFHIEWQYSDTNITITAKVKTTGWFGIGFSPNGGMAGADIITAGFADGKPYLQDRYAERNGYPKMDDSQDVELLEGSQENGVTTVKFTRKHNTCDDKDMPVGTDTMRLIYAISADGSDTVSYHTASNRGTRSIYLRRKISVEHNTPDDAFTFDITVDKAEIPAFHTRYLCEVIRAPKLNEKHHLIKVEPLIQKENLGFVHHMLLYGCFDKVDRSHYFKTSNTSFECYNANMPQDLQTCKAPVIVWAIGGGTTYYPEEAGYPLGHDEAPDYYLLEVHYDNQQLVAGKVDSSGLRLTLTKTLRKYDAGIINAGGIMGIAVPPQVNSFDYTGYCARSCTNSLLKEEIKIFGSALHGHLAARQITARHFRNGTEIGIIDRDGHYDFNYQQVKMFEKPIEMLPGDDIMVTCNYNTEGRTGMTYGGLPSSSEMCISFLFYYPAQELSECYTVPVWVDPKISRQFLNENLKYPTTVPAGNIVEDFEKITSTGQWTEERIRELEKSYHSYMQVDDCSTIAGEKINGYLKTPYYPPTDASKPSTGNDIAAECAATTAV